MRKLIVIDKITGDVYVIPYDLAVHEDAFACIVAANEHYGTDIDEKQVDFVDVEQANITIL